MEALSRRIAERFPDSSLFQISRQILELAERAKSQAAAINRPILSLRILIVFLTAVIAAGVISSLSFLRLPQTEMAFAEVIQTFEAGVNDVAFIGLALFFLASLETRWKRIRVLKPLHQLRVIAHIIDMHQLTKDPESVMHSGPRTSSSPRRTVTAFELGRYLDYCTEMLSLAGKIAVLYVQRFNEPAIVTAVNEIENLTTGLARKIWQKLIILESFRPLEEQIASAKEVLAPPGE